MLLRFYILTVSTSRAKDGLKLDTAGSSLEQEILKDFPDAEIARNWLIDDQKQIEIMLKRITNSKKFNVLITVGGTGFAKDDVTPEATRAVIDREAPGLTHVLLSKSLGATEMAMLSRPVCGIKDETIVVNFPGSARAALECWSFIKDAIPHAVAVLIGDKNSIERVHRKIQNPGDAISDSKVNNLNYADDTESSVSAKNEEQLKNKSQACLNLVAYWSTSNGIKLNNTKTVVIKFLPKNTSTDSSLLLRVEGQSIENVENSKFLGVYIDQKLTWNRHIDHVLAKLSSCSFLILNIRDTVSLDVLKLVYFGLFQSAMAYGIIHWGNAARVDQILIAQKRAIRYMTKSSKRTSCKDLFKSLKIMTFPSLFIYSLLIYVKVIAGASRLRKNNYPMLEVPDAQKIVFEKVFQLASEEIPVSQSLGRILADDIVALDPIPPFPASIKDGYAVIAQDGAGLRRVRAAIAAGDDPGNTILQSGEIVRISTGAPVPPGADAVVQVEDTDLVQTSEDGEQEVIVEIKVAPTIGQDIRKIGSDCLEGTLVLKKHSRISAAYAGVLTMLGYIKVNVIRQPTVGVISTGNELRPADAALEPGQIRDSNKITLLSLLKSFGYEARDCGIAKDTPNDTKIIFQKAFEENDVIISSGGVSMGEYDLIKQVLITDFAATIHFGRLNMKPGKPTVFATLRYNGKWKYVFALPGNPVSCCVTSLLFVIPALKFMERDANFNGLPQVKVTLQQDIVNKDVRPEYVRLDVSVNQNGDFIGMTTGNQISSRLNSMVDANALLLVPGQATFNSNDKRLVYLFGQLH